MVAAGFPIATMVMQRAVFSLVVASDGVAALVAAAVLAARLATTAPVHLRIGTWLRGKHAYVASCACVNPPGKARSPHTAEQSLDRGPAFRESRGAR